MALRLSRNAAGKNQHRNQAVIDELPNLKDILQKYVNDGVKEIDMPAALLEDHQVSLSLRTIQKYKKELGVLTARRNGLTASQAAEAVDLAEQDDPLGKYGGRLIQEKLRNKGIHIPRDCILTYRALKNPANNRACHPRTRKVHSHGIHSIGPNENWGVDGHEKILNSMGIAIYGVIDQFSRMELALWAMPNARLAEIPPAVILRLMKEKGGMPLTVTGDKGSELGLLISLITTMRAHFQPYIPENRLPAFKAVKSVYNITRERAWRTLWHTEISNVGHEYEIGKVSSGFDGRIPLHFRISSWLWGAIVQARLDELLHEHQLHRIRKQKNILLPSGARRIDLYKKPENYGRFYKDRLITIPDNALNELLDKYDRPDLFAFGSLADVAVCKRIYTAIGSPKLVARHGWEIFGDMVEYYQDNSESLDHDFELEHSST